MWTSVVLEIHPHADLRGEGNAYGGARSEEISQSAFGYLKLLQAGDGCGLGAACIAANTGDVRDALPIGLHLRCRNWQLRNVDCEVCAGIVAVEQVEELDEGVDLPALVDFEGACDAEVGLDVRRAAEYVEAGVRSIDIDAVGVVCVRDRDGAGALELIDGAQLESPGNVHRAGQHHAMANVFAGGSVVAFSESI